ncbi:MAG: hypothetical protein WBC04_21815 [Candidatus Acidiferrales bacterium]
MKNQGKPEARLEALERRIVEFVRSCEDYCLANEASLQALKKRVDADLGKKDYEINLLLRSAVGRRLSRSKQSTKNLVLALLKQMSDGLRR